MSQTKMPRGVRIISGKLQIIYQHAGRRRFEVLDLRPTASGIAEAVRIREQRLKAMKYGLVEDDHHQTRYGTFAEVAQQYLDHAEIETSTRGGYRSSLNTYWMPHLQHHAIAAIQLPTLRRIDREITWSTHKTRKDAISVLRQVFQFAVDDGYRDDNPVAQLRVKRRAASKPRPDPYTPNERDALLDWLRTNESQTIHAYFLVAFYSGMRTGELIALDWASFDGESFMVDKARVRGLLKSTKTNVARRVLMPGFVCYALNKLPSRFKQGALFLNQYGEPYESAYHLNKRFRAAHAATGIRHREGPYPWRHTYASIGLTNGADPAWLAKQLGHSKVMFYTVYADWISSDADKAQLDKLVAKTCIQRATNEDAG